VEQFQLQLVGLCVQREGRLAAGIKAPQRAAQRRRGAIWLLPNRYSAGLIRLVSRLAAATLLSLLPCSLSRYVYYSIGVEVCQPLFIKFFIFFFIFFFADFFPVCRICRSDKIFYKSACDNVFKISHFKSPSCCYIYYGKGLRGQPLFVLPSCQMRRRRKLDNRSVLYDFPFLFSGGVAVYPAVIAISENVNPTSVLCHCFVLLFLDPRFLSFCNYKIPYFGTFVNPFF